MRKIIAATGAALALTAAGLFGGMPALATGIKTLRGPVAITDQAPPPELYKTDVPKTRFQRAFPQQPPLITHRIDDSPKFEISRDENGCLECHGKDSYEEKNAPMAAKSHYTAPDGKESETLMMNRYFCTQCHVPQMDAKPLVENTFTASKAGK